MSNGWIGVDLDGTLAEYDGWRGPEHIGAPIEPMVARVKQWLAEGMNVRIFTARAHHVEHLGVVEAWCRDHLGAILPVTATKDFAMIALWDDRCVTVERNTGIILTDLDRVDG